MAPEHPGPAFHWQAPAHQAPAPQTPDYGQRFAPPQNPAYPQQQPARVYPQQQTPSYPQQPPPSYVQQPPPAYPQQQPARSYPQQPQAPQNPPYFPPQAPTYPSAPFGAQQPPATPTYNPAYGLRSYPSGPPSAPPGWQATPTWAPPQQYAPGYQGPPGSFGPYGLQPGPYGLPPGPYAYPPVAPAKKRHTGRVLLVLLTVAILIGVAVPVISTITTSGYVNQSYVPPQPDTNPPALPKVTGEGTARETVTASSLYAQSVPNPTRCMVTTIDLSAASEAELQAHMSDVVACLMRVWDTTVTKAGFELPRPPVIVYSAAISTSCGKLATLNAAYCGSDQKIYYATDLPQAIPNELRSSRFIVEVIVAHEFGHAVQARTGILSAAHGLSDAATTEADSNQWSRRTELQADCFAGLFIRSVSKSAGINQQDLDNIATLMVAFGDDSLSKNSGVDGGHGLGTTRKYWIQLGLASTAVNVCNTFTVAADEVR